MARKLLTREELAEWMTAQLRKVEDCEECSVGPVNLLQQPDTDGCNWSDSLVVQSAGVPREHFGPHVAQIGAMAKAMFNIA